MLSSAAELVLFEQKTCQYMKSEVYFYSIHHFSLLNSIPYMQTEWGQLDLCFYFVLLLCKNQFIYKYNRIYASCFSVCVLGKKDS